MMTIPRVMIVEDEVSLGVMLRYNLESAQYQVDVVDRGDEAEIRISESPPDLITLMERPGRVFSREHLLDAIWGRNTFIDERTVDVHIGRLRKALIKGAETDPIRTVRGAGYSLNEQFEKASSDE